MHKVTSSITATHTLTTKSLVPRAEEVRRRVILINATLGCAAACSRLTSPKPADRQAERFTVARLGGGGPPRRRAYSRGPARPLSPISSARKTWPPSWLSDRE